MQAARARAQLAAMALAAFAAAVAMVAISVAVPAIGRTWSLEQDQIHWVASGFMLAMVPAMFFTPLLLRRLGVRHTALAALLLLIAAGMVGACAPSFAVLIAARAVEGTAAGVLQPLPLLVVARAYASAERGRAMGLFTLGPVLAPTLAPALAGALADHLGWRAVLLAASPFAAIAALVAWRVLTVDEGTPAATRSSLRSELFANAEFRRSCLVAFIYGMAIFAASYLVPVYVQLALGRSAAVAGAALIPSGVALAIASPWGGRLADRVARHRMIAIGMAAFGLAHLPIIAITPASSLLWFVASLIASRLGMALALPSLALDALRALPDADWPAASAIVSLTRQAGAALGIVVASLFVHWRFVAEGSALHAFRQGFIFVALLSLVGSWLAWQNEGTRSAAR